MWIAGEVGAELPAMEQAAPMNPVHDRRTLHSFVPAADADARVLILGSMPGHVSLCAGQYYAHSRNAFWPIMDKLFGIDPARPYAERLQALQERGIALWDVLRSCERVGSLDQAIDGLSVTVNDFRIFFGQHAQLRTVLFNGRAAAHYYRLHVLPSLQRPDLIFVRLPSTSAAMASLSVPQKAAEWGLCLKPSAREIRKASSARAPAHRGTSASRASQPGCLAPP